jgi:hypothetical protein
MYPDMMVRTCEKCEAFMYDDRAGEMGPPTYLEDGTHMPRPVGCGTPCFQCPKVPKSAPKRDRENAIEPTDKSRAALYHYQECRAVGRFPLDVIVQRNAGLIAPIERQAEFANAKDAAGTIALLLASGGKRG